MRNILFICTSNKDRSPALERYFSTVYPNYEYRSAGINKYFTTQKGTHYLTQEDLDWADLVVFAEEIHWEVVSKNFLDFYPKHDNSFSDAEDNDNEKATPVFKKIVLLDCGNYEKGCVGDDYILKAEYKLKDILTINKIKTKQL